MIMDLFRKGTVPATDHKAARASAAALLAAGASRVAWSPRDTTSLTRAAFCGNPVGYRCVRMISEAAATIPLTLSTQGMPMDTHPLLDLLATPNPAQSQAELLEALYGQLLLSGNAYLEAAGEASELHVLRSDRMQVVPGPDGWPQAYDYQVAGRKHRFPVDPDCPVICHVKNFHPQDDHYGLSPLQAAATALDVHDAASRWSKALLDNAARPSGAIVYSSADGQGMLSPDQYDRLVSEMETHHTGARNAGRPMLLEGGLDWKPMGFSPSDMEFQKTKEAAARDIALAFGVPPMMLGIPGDATYANYAEANRAFYRLTVLPLATRVTAKLAAWLTKLNSDPVTLTPDLDQIPALAVEREAHWRRISRADFLSDAEKRRAVGLPEDPS